MAGSTALLSTLFLLSLANFTAAADPQWQWARRGFSSGTFDSVYGLGIATDSHGDVYVAGKFSGTATFGDTNAPLTSFGNSDAFLAKYSKQGQLLWAKQFGGAGVDEADSVAIDQNDDIYLSGGYNGPAKFDTLTLTNNARGFVAKLAGATAQVEWVKDAALEWFSIAVDHNSNVYVTGEALPFQLVGTKAAGPITVAKYDSTGGLRWFTNSLAGFTTAGVGKKIAIDQAGSCYITGTFREVIQFGALSLTNAAAPNNNYDEIFIAKFTTEGVPQWAQRAGGQGNDAGLGIGVDGAGNIVVTGYCDSTSSLNGGTSVDFDIGGFVFPGAVGGGLGNLFLAKFDTTGKGLWARKLPGISSGADLSVTSAGEVFASGFFRTSPLDFGGITLAKDWSNEEIFAVKYDQAGTAVWGRRTSSTQVGVRHGMAICVDNEGAVCVTGDHAGVFPVDFDGTALGSTSSGVSMFVARLSAASSSPAIEALTLLTGGVVRLAVTGAEGQSFIIEASQALGNWNSISTNTVNGGVIQFTDTGRTAASNRFYRLRAP